MHGPFIVAQRAKGLLQDLARVNSPQRVDLTGWSMPQVPHKRPQVVKVGILESRISSGIRMRSRTRREPGENRIVTARQRLKRHGRVRRSVCRWAKVGTRPPGPKTSKCRVWLGCLTQHITQGTRRRWKRVKLSPSKCREYMNALALNSPPAGPVSVHHLSRSRCSDRVALLRRFVCLALSAPSAHAPEIDSGPYRHSR